MGIEHADRVTAVGALLPSFLMACVDERLKAVNRTDSMGPPPRVPAFEVSEDLVRTGIEIVKEALDRCSETRREAVKGAYGRSPERFIWGTCRSDHCRGATAGFQHLFGMGSSLLLAAVLLKADLDFAVSVFNK